MHALDQKIQHTLAADEAELLSPLGEPPLWHQIIEMFQGRLRWITLLVVVGSLACAVFAVVSAVYFFQAEGVREMIAWAGGFGFGLISVTAGRIWMWMILHRNAVMREIKRVELRIARLGSQLDKIK